MGVDARMFAKLRSNYLTERDELAAARELAAVIGPANFMITKGNPIFAGWGNPHHALSILQPLSEKEAKDYEHPELVGHVVYFQDGDPVVAQDGEQFIKVHLMSRYYGEGYARGHWPTIRAIAEWLEFKFPRCEVWYGGDSSGICAELLDRPRRDQLNHFYLETGTSTYGRGFHDIFAKGETSPNCPTCETPMRATGGGSGMTFFYCESCLNRCITSPDHADPRWLRPGEDFLGRSRQGRLIPSGRSRERPISRTHSEK